MVIVPAIPMIVMVMAVRPMMVGRASLGNVLNTSIDGDRARYRRQPDLSQIDVNRKSRAAIAVGSPHLRFECPDRRAARRPGLPRSPFENQVERLLARDACQAGEHAGASGTPP